MLDGLPEFFQYTSRLVLKGNLRGPLPVVVYHHMGDLLNAANYAMTHYFPLTLEESFLQNSRHGTPYQKWALFTNQDFATMDECFRRLLVAMSRYYAEAAGAFNESDALKDAWHWAYAAATAYASCRVERDEMKLTLSRLNLTGWTSSTDSWFVRARERLSQRPENLPPIVAKDTVDIRDRSVVYGLHREGLSQLRQLEQILTLFRTNLRTSLSIGDVLASHEGHLSSTWIGVATVAGTSPK
jgi:hypothetical protein